MPSEEKLARRREFETYKTKLLRQNNISLLICARCGYENKSNHLHHIKEVVYGGEDSAKNLVPLCSECHKEWDVCSAIGMNLGEFLVSVSSITLQLSIAKGLLYSNVATVDVLKTIYEAQFSVNSMKSQHDDYWEEIEKQNSVFNTYPYSDHTAMMNTYGSMYKTT